MLNSLERKFLHRYCIGSILLFVTEKAKILLEDAEKYALSFNEIFMEMDCHTEVDVLSREKSIVEFFKKSEELKIHFLFPNVSDEIRDLIFKLVWKRAAISHSRNSRSDEAIIAQMEFVEISSSVRELLDDLLPVQAEIIAEKYLSNPLSA
jgi:hypothetical protein